MSNPHQPIIDKINSTFGLIERNQTISQVDFDTEIAPILSQIATIIEEDRGTTVERLVTDLKDPLNATSGEEWFQMLKKLSTDVSKLSNENRKYRDRAEEIHKNEKRAQWRTFWFRLLTTAALGLSVMVLYSLAAHFEWLSMPLQMNSVSKIAPLL